MVSPGRVPGRTKGGKIHGPGDGGEERRGDDDGSRVERWVCGGGGRPPPRPSPTNCVGEGGRNPTAPAHRCEQVHRNIRRSVPVAPERACAAGWGSPFPHAVYGGRAGDGGLCPSAGFLESPPA